MEEKNFKKYFFWACFLLVAIVTYFIIENFIVSIASAFVLSYLLHPIHKLLKKWVPEKLSAFLLILLVVLVLLVPAYFIIRLLVAQIPAIAEKESLQKAYDLLSMLNFQPELLGALPDLASKSLSYLLSLVYSVIKYLPVLLLNFIVTLFLAFYFILGWDRINKEIKEMLPFKNKSKIIKEFSETAYNIVFGCLLVAIIEFIIALIGFYLIGVEYYLLFAFLIALFALVPLIGPGFVWVPLAGFKLLSGDYLSAILIFALGVVLSFGVDFFLKTAIIGKKAKIHQAIVLIGALGGVKLFGIFGFIIGPLILGFFINFIKAALKNKE